MITPIDYRAPRYADSDPNGNTDNVNGFCKELWNNQFREEHDGDGDHKADLLASFDKFETGNYTGNGADDRNISLTDSTTDIAYIKIWSGSIAYHYFRSSSMTGDNTARSYSGEAFQSDQIQSVATTGQFQIGADSDVNANAIDYYYAVWGS